MYAWLNASCLQAIYYPPLIYIAQGGAAALLYFLYKFNLITLLFRPSVLCRIIPFMFVCIVFTALRTFSSNTKACGSRGRSVGILTKLRAGRPGFDSRQEPDFSPCHRVLTGSGAHPASYPLGTGGLSLVVEHPRHEADHSPPSSAEVKNSWSYTSTPRICLHGMVLN
jgi:hypothetical protein